MNTYWHPTVVAAIAMLAFGTWPADAQQPAGRLAVRWALGPTFVISNADLRERSRVGPAINGSVLWDSTEKMGVLFTYDRLDAARDLESETFTGGLRLTSQRYSEWRPFVELGAGVGRRDVGEGFKKLAIRANLGISRMISSRVSMGAMATYHFIETQDITSGDMHTVVPSVFTAYHFGPT